MTRATRALYWLVLALVPVFALLAVFAYRDCREAGNTALYCLMSLG